MYEVCFACFWMNVCSNVCTAGWVFLSMRAMCASMYATCDAYAKKTKNGVCVGACACWPARTLVCIYLRPENTSGMHVGRNANITRSCSYKYVRKHLCVLAGSSIITFKMQRSRNLLSLSQSEALPPFVICTHHTPIFHSRHLTQFFLQSWKKHNIERKSSSEGLFNSQSGGRR